jgi:hypothetical protein
MSKIKESHFKAYQRLMNDPMPFGDNVYPDVSGLYHGFPDMWTVTRDGVFRAATEQEYKEDFKLIHKQYLRYQIWSIDNPE